MFSNFIKTNYRINSNRKAAMKHAVSALQEMSSGFFPCMEIDVRPYRSGGPEAIGTSSVIF